MRPTAVGAPDPDDDRLGEILAKAKLISWEQLARIREIRSHTGQSMEELLAQEQVSPDTLLKARAYLHQMRAVDLAATTVQLDAVAIIPGELARRHGVMPVAVIWDPQSGEAVLVVAVSDPLAIEALDASREAARMKVQPVLAWPEQIRQAIERHYPAIGDA